MIGSIRSDVPATNIFNRKVFYIKTNIVTWIGGLELLLIHHCWTWNRQRYQRVSQSLFSYLLSLPLSPFPFQQRLKYHGNTEHQQLTWAKWNFVQLFTMKNWMDVLVQPLMGALVRSNTQTAYSTLVSSYNNQVTARRFKKAFVLRRETTKSLMREGIYLLFASWLSVFLLRKNDVPTILL